MVAIILWAVLLKVVTMVNTNYCLMQTPNVQSLLSEMVKISIEKTWELIKKINKCIEWIPLLIFIELLLEFALIANFMR